MKFLKNKRWYSFGAGLIAYNQMSMMARMGHHNHYYHRNNYYSSSSYSKYSNINIL
jgi:hypothetical protein